MERNPNEVGEDQGIMNHSKQSRVRCFDVVPVQKSWRNLSPATSRHDSHPDTLHSSKASTRRMKALKLCITKGREDKPLRRRAKPPTPAQTAVLCLKRCYSSSPTRETTSSSSVMLFFKKYIISHWLNSLVVERKRHFKKEGERRDSSNELSPHVSALWVILESQNKDSKSELNDFPGVPLSCRDSLPFSPLLLPRERWGKWTTLSWLL